MTQDKLALRKAIRGAVVEAIEMVGWRTVKQMSWFGSNDPAYQEKGHKQAA